MCGRENFASGGLGLEVRRWVQNPGCLLWASVRVLQLCSGTALLVQSSLLLCRLLRPWGRTWLPVLAQIQVQQLVRVLIEGWTQSQVLQLRLEGAAAGVRL